MTPTDTLQPAQPVPAAGQNQFDSILFVSFGGPERPEDIMPFLQRVTKGRPVPAERLAEVATHYEHFGGKSPLNDQNRAMIAALRQELDAHHINLPIYFGNRNWHPFLEDTVKDMGHKGLSRSIVFITSAFSSYSGCRQYLEDLERARTSAGPAALETVKVRGFHGDGQFLAAMADQINLELQYFAETDRRNIPIVFTAHSIPDSMAANCDYQMQLETAAQKVAQLIGSNQHYVAYQSRSGSPSVPWLGPDILDQLRELRAQGVTQVVVAPIGFISDHMEVIYDLDHEAAELATSLGLTMRRAKTVGTSPKFIQMIRELIEERLHGPVEPANLTSCHANCCQAAQRPQAERTGQ